MTDRWPAIRTHRPAHREYEMGHAASIGLAVVLIILPLLGLGLSWLSKAPVEEAAQGVTFYGVAQMLAYSPLVSWVGLMIGMPAVYSAIRLGYGGWLVTMAIGAIAGMIVLFVAVWFVIDFTGLRIVFIGGAFGALFAGVFWLAMRLTNPALFRASDLNARSAR